MITLFGNKRLKDLFGKLDGSLKETKRLADVHAKRQVKAAERIDDLRDRINNLESDLSDQQLAHNDAKNMLRVQVDRTAKLTKLIEEFESRLEEIV